IDKVKVTENGNFGELHTTNLIPETVLVKKDSIEISRFEVTNAQFKAYKPSFNFDAGLDNYPVVTSKDEALKYIQWLSNITGDKYRLPNSKEAKNLQKAAHKAAAKENTLNYWAGFGITIDEVEELNKKVTELKSHLLKKVGKNKHVKVGEAEVYDLGGNVAEYFETGIYGYSAYDFYDANNTNMIESKYVGIRVIKE
ncbi:formylglycine-generating enzyme family protein, partial [Lutibacter sp.]|uniref:formylglycine-generating enzyme family protein n=1 Tax=Lutibacter sp. TaxID=1925666 RepID=UPI00349FF4AB